MTGGDLTCDGFLGGAIRVHQPRAGYRAGTDAVMLAAACPAGPGDQVLELGCGVGVAALCLAHRTGAGVTALEIDPDTAALARRNAAENSLNVTVSCGDLAEMPPEIRARNFDHVIANPPYFRRDTGTRPPDSARSRANHEGTPLAEWVSAATRRLAPRGTLTLILSADRLGDLLSSIDDRLGGIRILPIAGRVGQPAGRIILRATKGARAPLQLLAPMVLHRHAAHKNDRSDHTAEAEKILRGGEALDLDRLTSP